MSRNTVPQNLGWILKHRAFNQCGLSSFAPRNFSHTEIPTWLKTNSEFECHIYDHEVPPGYDAPAKFFDVNDSWVVVVLTQNPYDVVEPHPLFSHPKTIARCYAEKDDKYDAPRSFFIEDIEIGWVGFQYIGNCIFVHCIQVRGAYKEFSSLNDLLSIYRHLIRCFVQMVPQEVRKNIVVPDATIMASFAQAPTVPYSSKVLGRSKFVKVSHKTFAKRFRVAEEKRLFPVGDMWVYKR